MLPLVRYFLNLIIFFRLILFCFFFFAPYFNQFLHTSVFQTCLLTIAWSQVVPYCSFFLYIFFMEIFCLESDISHSEASVIFLWFFLLTLLSMGYVPKCKAAKQCYQQEACHLRILSNIALVTLHLHMCKRTPP